MHEINVFACIREKGCYFHVEREGRRLIDRRVVNVGSPPEKTKDEETPSPGFG